MRRALFMTVLYLLLAVRPGYAQNTREAEIVWDTWGVPHITAAHNDGWFYGFGWAQAHNHLNLLLKLYGESRGRAAEYWGEDFRDSDLRLRSVGIPQQGQRGYEQLDPEWQHYLDTFAQGINDYAAAHPDAIAEQNAIVLPVTPQDVVAHGLRVMRYEFVARAGLNYARSTWASGQAYTPDSAALMGSNGWAIAPSRAASGNALLVVNPHQPWFEFGLWIEAHMITPDANMYGAALIGNPVISVGFNESLGWTHTVNTHDGWDLYKLTLTEDGGYLLDGEAVPFETRVEEIRIRQPDDTFRTETHTFKTSVQGAVVAERGQEALALRVVGDNTGYEMAVQWWQMGHARDFESFEAVMRDIRIPMFTVIYADRDGNIMHLFNELIPVRDFGDWAYWNNTTPADRNPVALIDGSTSETLWDETYHPYDDLPKLINPDTGWVQNANEPPWTATYPYALNPDDYPAYFAPRPFVWPRPQQSMRLLHSDESITFEELVTYKHSTYAELRDLLLEDLITAARASDNVLAQRSADVLAAWDGYTDADSVGAALFTLWTLAYIEPLRFAAFENPWNPDEPFTTPNQLADPEGAVETLIEVARQLELARLLGGGIDAPYGNVFRVRWGAYDLPSNGSYDLLGTFRSMTYQPDSDLRFRAVLGESFIAVVEFTEAGPRAEVLLAYGNATQPDSPHFGDQLTLFTEKRLRPAWFTRADIEANAAAIEMVGTP